MIAVGDSGEVELIFTAAKGQRGKISKSATVTCNDNDRANFNLTLAGMIYPNDHPDSLKPLTLSQSGVKWDPNSKSHEAKLVIKNVSNQPLRLSLVSLPEEFLNVEIPDDVLKPGKSKEIKVRTAKTFAGADFKKSFTFECSDAEHTRYTVPVELAATVATTAPKRVNPPPPVGKQRAVDTTKTQTGTDNGKTH